MRRIFWLFLLFVSSQVFSQRLLTDVIDTSTIEGKQLKILSDKFGNLAFSGYIQPQFQVAQEKGAPADYQGGAFATNSANRFRLRRGRLRADYMSYHKDGSPSTFFVLQFDGTEQGVNIRDFWGRYYENKLNMFSITGGMMARPFGYEVLLSSSARETPERGRMSQILMKTERDLGALLTFHPRLETQKLKNLQIDLGIYNGQGMAGPTEYDNKKDVISRVAIRNAKLGDYKYNIGVSALLGGIVSETAKLYSMQHNGNLWQMVKDSASANIGKITARQYFGGDFQIKTPSKNWRTELRAEYIFGQQTGTANSSVTPGSYPVKEGVKQALYTRSFNGAYFYFLQNIINASNQFIVKYDWYDPNTKVKAKEVTPVNGFSEADIRYNTLGVGFLRHINSNLKLFFWYDHIKNEATAITGYEKDAKDNIFTLRAQFMF
ncbi:MAG: porin [Niabella sp.]